MYAKDDQWITVKPNGPDATGRPALIGEGGEIKAGMGGKFNGQKINEIPRTFENPTWKAKQPGGSAAPTGARPTTTRPSWLPGKEEYGTEWNGKIYAGNRVFINGKSVTIPESGMEEFNYYMESLKQRNVYLDIPYEKKDMARKAGARWDNEARQWYVPGGKKMPSGLEKYAERYSARAREWIDMQLDGHGAGGCKPPSYDDMLADALSLDSNPSSRRFDENGFLHVAVSHISKETVNPYYGREIPGWKEQGLDPDKIYQGYRKGDELAASAETFNGLPLLLGHYAESADEPQKEHRVGSLGTDAVFNAPYLDNSLIITDAEAIKAIESGKAVELSSAYRYEPVFESGEFNGEHYDFIMTNIRGNHVALVEEGRAGSDVAVADEQIKKNPLRKIFMAKKITAKGLLRKLGFATDNAPEEIAEAAENLAEAISEKAGEGESVKASFDEEATKILQNNELDEAAKVEALKELAEGLKEVAKAADNELAKQPDTLGAEDYDPEKLKALMVEAGLDPEDEAAAKVFLAGLKASKAMTGDEEQEKPNGDTDPDKDKAGEDTDPEEEKTNGASDRKTVKTPKGPKPLTAMDAAVIQQKAENRVLQKVRALNTAAQEVRNLCGDVDPLSFDSAGGIYAHALKRAGVRFTTSDPAALRDMVLREIEQKSKATTVPAFYEQAMDGAFAGLKNIKIQL